MTLDRVEAIQQAWARERPDVDVSSIGVLTRMVLIGRHLARERARALRKLGTDTPTLDVLATLRRSGPPYRLRTSELEQAASVTAGAISQRLDRLEARGLVRRERDERDRRRVDVHLTEQGKALIDGVVAGLMKEEGRLLDPLPPEDQVTLERILTVWLRRLDANHASRSRSRRTNSSV